MSSTNHSSFGYLLRQRRTDRGLTQEKLAYRADLSTRHVSFLETGRSNPSRESALALARALDLPLRDRNALLHAAGFAPVYPDRSLDTPEREHVRSLLDFVLERHEPYPCYVLDHAWTVKAHNRGAIRLLEWLGGQAPAPDEGEVQDAPLAGLNLLRLVFDPCALRPLLVNFDQVGSFLLHRLEQEVALRPGDQGLTALLDELRSYGPSPDPDPVGPGGRDAPLLPIHLRKDGTDVKLATFLMTVGAPLDVSLQETRIETFLPADPDTEAFLRELARECGG